MTNHIAKNIITKGYIFSDPLSKGIIRMASKIITSTGKRGGVSYDKLQRDIREIGVEDILAIKVYVDWWKKAPRNKQVTADLLEKKIYAELLSQNETSAKNINIEVKLME